MIKYANDYKKGIILVIIGIILLAIMFYYNIQNKNANLQTKIIEYEANSNVFSKESKKELTEEEILDILLEEKNQVIDFYAKTFQINKDTLTLILRAKYQELNLLNTDNFDYVVIEYLLELEKSNKELFSNKIIPCQDSKEYMVALIKYFTNIYNNVDFNIAAAIAQIESNYSAPGMLNKNNIFGGMYNGNLIKYKNIEYGILKYIKLLNDGYFNKGLTTVESIGRVYNPTFNENGIKVAKQSWVNSVTKELENFKNLNQPVDISTLNILKTNS